MRIIICHNFYQQAGGEDQVFADETALLTERGHHVVTFTRHNDAVSGMRPWTLAARTIWNSQASRDLAKLVREHQADIVHFHNTLPLISPAAYYAARRAGAAVVQTLHNYRLICPKATLFRDGAPCESCLGKRIPMPAVRHACYRDSRAASATVAAMLAYHRWRGTYQRSVDAYVAISNFSRDKLVAGGLPAEKIHLRPNFMLDDPGTGTGAGRYALYLGRLSPEKDLATLLTAWQQHDPGLPLIVCGNGPLSPLVEKAAATCNRIKWIPGCSHDEALRRLGAAAMLVLPSAWYEACPKTIIEAYSKGTPVVASRLGAMAELVREGHSGACFAPGDAADLAATVRGLVADPTSLSRMRAGARRLFETHYSSPASYARLRDIYDCAMQVRHGTAPAVDHDAETMAVSNDTTMIDVQVHDQAQPQRKETELCAR